MGIRFFGQFLIDQGIIERSDLLRAIDLQERTNLRFGDLVVNMGLMTQEQIALVVRAQRHADLQFGEMAVKLGYLRPEQIDQVLEKQRSEHLYIGEALVRIGVLDNEQLEQHLAQFNTEQNATLTEKISIPEGVADQPIWSMVADMTYKMLRRLTTLPFRPGPCTEVAALPDRPIIVELGFSGSVSARYLLTLSEDTQKLVARAIIARQGEVAETADDLDEHLKEFVGLVCGNVVSKAAQLGYRIDITPARIRRRSEETEVAAKDHSGLMFPIYLTEGEVFEVTLFIQQSDA